MSRSLSRWQATLLGSVVLIVLGIAAWGLFQIGQQQGMWKQTVEVQARFAHIQGVVPGTPVRLYGMPIGQVSAVERPRLDDVTRAVTLRLRIDAEYRTHLAADAVAKIVTEGMIGTRVVELDPGTAGELALDQPIPGKAVGDFADLARKADEALADLRSVQRDVSRVLGQTSDALAVVSKGKGTIGKLANDDEAYRELVRLLRETQGLVATGQETIAAVKQDAEAIKKLPVVRSFVPESANELLIRPNFDRLRLVYSTDELLETERCILSGAGKAKLDETGVWLIGNRISGSEVIVVAYAHPEASDTPDIAKTTTAKQAEAVLAYLKDRHGVHKTSAYVPSWMSSRKAVALGMGKASPPVAEKEKLPPARIEVLLLTPQR